MFIYRSIVSLHMPKNILIAERRTMIRIYPSYLWTTDAFVHIRQIYDPFIKIIPLTISTPLLWSIPRCRWAFRRSDVTAMFRDIAIQFRAGRRCLLDIVIRHTLSSSLILFIIIITCFLYIIISINLYFVL